jgi:hypothetical protein
MNEASDECAICRPGKKCAVPETAVIWQYTVKPIKYFLFSNYQKLSPACGYY